MNGKIINIPQNKQCFLSLIGVKGLLKNKGWPYIFLFIDNRPVSVYGCCVYGVCR